MSPDLLPQKVFPLLEQDQESTFFLLIDCLRYDQWRSFQELLTAYFRIEEETSYYSILPTATQYARNSIFAGLFPSEIKERFPRYWVDDDEQEGKNKHESDFLQELISRKRMNIRSSYHKLIRGEDSKQLGENIKSLLQNELNVIVVNFIDMVAHARAEMNIIKELAPDESALRSLSRSWLEHSTLFSILKQLAQHNVRIVLTTDHGVIRVRKPVKIIGDRDTTTNLRYKQGRNLNYDTKARQIFSVTKPEAAGLPKSSVSATYAFLSEDYFFVYPNNYNHYVNQYTDTLQHGGISLEEMIVPYAVLRPK
jgi:hypothetical protein